MVRAVIYVVCGPQEAQHGLSWTAGERNLDFYANDGRIAGQDRKWVQDTLTKIVSMFHRMGLDTNLKKTKSIVCTTSFIWGKWSDKDYKGRRRGKERHLGRRIVCG